MLKQKEGRVLKWYNISKQSKIKRKVKYKNLHRVGIMYNLKDKLCTE